MTISFSQYDIEEAISEYLKKRNIITNDQKIYISFETKRKGDLNNKVNCSIWFIDKDPESNQQTEKNSTNENILKDDNDDLDFLGLEE